MSRRRIDLSRYIDVDLTQQVEQTTDDADNESTIHAYLGRVLLLESFLKSYRGDQDFQMYDRRSQRLTAMPTIDEFLAFLEAKRKHYPGIRASTLAGYRSALWKFASDYSDQGIVWFTEQEAKRLKRYLKGVENNASAEVRAGRLAGEEGKRHLKVEEYVALCDETIGCVEGQHVTEVHLLLTSLWNLMARSETGGAIHSRHLDWENDALLVGISKSKRFTLEKAVYYHLFANPFRPAVCVVLALALHLAVNHHILGTGPFGGSLFHDASLFNDATDADGNEETAPSVLQSNNESHQDESRRRRTLGLTCKRLLKDILQRLHIVGIGWHSPRKGSISLACGGTPELAPLVAVIIRARWSAKEWAVLRKYAKQMGAGDSLVGRLLALLNPQRSEFKVIAPHFKRAVDGEEDEALLSDKDTAQLCVEIFGNIKAEGAARAAPFLAASLIYHYEYLQAALPPNHSLWQSPFGRIPADRIARLQAQISIKEDSGITAAGVPSTVHMMENIESLQHSLQDGLAQQQEILQQLQTEVKGIARCLPLSVAGQGLEANRQMLQEFVGAFSERVEQVLQSHQYVTNQEAEQQPPEAATPPGTRSIQQGAHGYNTYSWGGKMRVIPADFTYLRSIKIHAGFELWWNGYRTGDMPLSVMLHSDQEYQKDIVDLLRHRDTVAGTSAAEIKKHTQSMHAAIHELKAVMLFLEAELQKDPHTQEQLAALQAAIKSIPRDYTQIRPLQSAVWEAALGVINCQLGTQAAFRATAIESRRRYDFSTVAVRTVHRLTLRLRAHQAARPTARRRRPSSTTPRRVRRRLQTS